MPLPGFIFYDGDLLPASGVSLSPANRSFRYGDGFFETIRMVNGQIPLWELHGNRLFRSLQKMHFQQPDHLTKKYFFEAITAVAGKNGHSACARVRISFFRGDGGLMEMNDHFPHHIVQTWPLDPAYVQLNRNGLHIGLFTGAKKICDDYSSIKHNNCLPYVMAALHAQQRGWDEALVLNPHHRIAEATIANVFIVKNGVVHTPSLEEGCVDGVMRRYMLEQFDIHNVSFSEKALSVTDMEEADEVFLTNALYGMRWVERLGEKVYGKEVTSLLYDKIVAGVG